MSPIVQRSFEQRSLDVQHRHYAVHLIKLLGSLRKGPLFKVKVPVIDRRNDQLIAIHPDRDIRQLLFFTEVERLRQQEVYPQLLCPKGFVAALFSLDLGDQPAILLRQPGILKVSISAAAASA